MKKKLEDQTKKFEYKLISSENKYQSLQNEINDLKDKLIKLAE